MQDRLKSRVWDKTEKVMHYNDYVLTATGHIAKIQECSNDNSIMYFNQTDLEFEKDKIIMQCTGLKDKNGKLIYEGDIVKSTSKYSFDDLGIIYFGKINNYQSFYVKWNITMRGDLYYWLEDKDEGLEVIGNIYENKELLNKSEVEE